MSENADEPSVTGPIARPRFRPRVGAFVAAALSLCTATSALAQDAPPAGGRGSAGGVTKTRESVQTRDDGVPRRLLAKFDFEDNAIFPREIPVGFYRALTRTSDDPGSEIPNGAEQGLPGLRNFGRIETVRGAGRAAPKGEPGWAVRFTVDGASMMLASDPSRVPVVPSAQIVVRAWAKTEGLQTSGVRIAARFYDRDGKGMPGVFSSAMFRSEGTWRLLVVEPPPAPPEAAGLSLWLELVQPSVVRDIEEPYQVAADDVRGLAFFDDIEVWQIPTVVFEAEGGGVVRTGVRPRLNLRCSDPSVTRTTAVIAIRDATESLVYQGTIEVPGDRSTKLEVPALATGWYEASVSYQQGPNEIAHRVARFTVLPDDLFEPDEAPRFGATFATRDERMLAALELSKSAFAVIPVWTVSTDVRESKDEIDSMRLLLAELLDRRVDPVFRIAQVPMQIARQSRVDTNDALALFALDESHWRGALEPWLLSFGQQVDHWIIGTSPVDGARGDLAARVEALATAMRSAIAGPSVGLPWSPAEQLPNDLRALVERGRHLVEVVAEPEWREGSGEIYSDLPSGSRGIARVVPLPPGAVDDRSRAIDLAIRGIDAWRAGYNSIAIDVPQNAAQSVPGPPIELAAWRQLSLKLSARRFVDEIDVAPGIRCMLADGPRGPVLVMWSDSVDGSTEVACDLSSGAITLTDLWGRTSRVGLTPRGHVFRVGREPVFVEGVDAALCKLRKSVRVEPGFALGKRALQEATIVLSNPWPVTVSGTLTVLGPEALQLSPRTHGFTMPAGGEARLPIALSVPRSMSAGLTSVTVAISGTATEPFRATIDAPLQLGNPAVRLEPSWRLARSIESGNIDLVLTLRVTNISDAPIDVDAFAVADGYTQSRKPLATLGPGASSVRVFHFASGARRLSGRDIRVGVHDTDADIRHLIRVPIPPILPPGKSVAKSVDATLGSVDDSDDLLE